MPEIDIIRVFEKLADKYENKLIKFNSTILHTIQPDINGYSFAFLIPPDLSGWEINEADIDKVVKMVTFAAVDITPPTIQVNTESVRHRTGGLPYATEVSPGEQLSVTYIDTSDMMIYALHYAWVDYIKKVTRGLVEPSDDYISPNGNEYGCIDYYGGMIIAKYRPTLDEPVMLGYAAGIFPQSIPSKETIGTRTSNEITTLPITYFCSEYKEVMSELQSHWIVDMFKERIITRFE